MRPLHLIAAACVAHAQNTVLLCGSAHTGTHHVKLALEALGLDVTVDHPQHARYDALLAAHPSSSKVLLTTRDAGRWRASIQQSRPEAALEKAQARREAHGKGRPHRGDDLAGAGPRGRRYVWRFYARSSALAKGAPAATDTLPRNLAMQKPPKIAPQSHESVSSLPRRPACGRASWRARRLYWSTRASRRSFTPALRIDRRDEEWPSAGSCASSCPRFLWWTAWLHHRAARPFDLSQKLPLASTPRLFVVPAAWRVLSLVQGAQELLKRAWALLDKVVAGRYWEPLMEHHVLLHISTARVVDAWGRRGHDHRLIVPHLEGPNGDHRKEVLRGGRGRSWRPTPRRAAAPRRRRAGRRRARGRAAVARLPARRGPEGRARARHAVAAAFRNVEGADVTLVEGESATRAFLRCVGKP